MAGGELLFCRFLSDFLRGRGSLSKWTIGHCSKKPRKHLTKERIRREKEAQGAEFMTPTQAETAENEWNEIRPLIDTALESLSEEDRGIIISRHLQQMSLKDAGTVLGINEDAAGKAGGQGRCPVARLVRKPWNLMHQRCSRRGAGKVRDGFCSAATRGANRFVCDRKLRRSCDRSCHAGSGF